MAATGHGLPRHHRPGKVRSRFSEETFARVSSRDGVAPNSGRSRAELEPMARPIAVIRRRMLITPIDNHVVARADHGMIRAGNVGPDEVRK